MNRRRAVLAVNDQGLILGVDTSGWSVWTSDGRCEPAEHRLLWLLPLLERDRHEIARAVDASLVQSLVRFALTAHGTYWPRLALDWLEAGWPADGMRATLTAMKDSTVLPQPVRHRAIRLLRGQSD